MGFSTTLKSSGSTKLLLMTCKLPVHRSHRRPSTDQDVMLLVCSDYIPRQESQIQVASSSEEDLGTRLGYNLLYKSVLWTKKKKSHDGHMVR